MAFAEQGGGGGGGGRRRKFSAAALGGDDDGDEEGSHFPPGYAKWSAPRKRIHGILASEKTDWFLATMILSSMAILIQDADLSAKRISASGLTPDEDFRAQVGNIVSTAYTCIYAIEMISRVYVFRIAVFRSAMLFDFIIVLTDVVLLIGDLTLGDAPQLSFLRMFRLARLARFVRVVGMFPELQSMAKGLIASFSAVFWGSILLWMVLLMWSIIAVYWIHPLHLEVLGDMSTCMGRECKAWSSVWHSVITLCQTVVFGDSWGMSAIEIIERYEWTLLYFAAMYGTITLGVLNLIVAAIVDSGAQAREEALEAKRRKQRSEELKAKERQKNRLLEICQVLDDDESGSLSFEELLTGFDKNQDFRNAMKDYNINRQELDVLFRVFDDEGTGVLDYQEFFNLIDSAREQASQQVLTFVRFAVMDLRKEIKYSQEQLRREVDEIKEFVVSVENSLNERICKFSGETPPPKKFFKKSSGLSTESPSIISEPGPKAKAEAKIAAKPAAKTAAKSAAPKPPPDRRNQRHGTELTLPNGEKPAPLQQLLKINRELLKGMKKLLDASSVDVAEIAHTAGASLSPRMSEGELATPRLTSDLSESKREVPREVSRSLSETRLAVPEGVERAPVRSFFLPDHDRDDERRTSI